MAALSCEEEGSDPVEVRQADPRPGRHQHLTHLQCKMMQGRPTVDTRVVDISPIPQGQLHHFHMTSLAGLEQTKAVMGSESNGSRGITNVSIPFQNKQVPVVDPDVE